MALKDDLEDRAAKNQKSTQFKEISTVTSELKTPKKLFENETDQQKRARRNANCVNAQIAETAGVSTAKVFHYKEIMEHGSPEEIAAQL